MKREAHITQQQLQVAIERFIEEGGLVKKLPPEVVPQALLVGSEHGRFEPVSYYAHAEALYI
jgi:hypothetical protein